MDRPVSILYTIPNFTTAGSQEVLLGICNRLDPWQSRAMVLVEKDPEAIPDVFPPENRYCLARTGSVLKRASALARLLKQIEPDLLHSWDYRSDPYEAIACRMVGVKYLYTKKNNAWSRRWFIKSLLAHHIAYDQPMMKDRFFKHPLLGRKVSLIPHGVDLRRFKPTENKDRSGFKLACLGTIGPNKNQLFLLECLSKLPSDYTLHLFGREDTTYRKQLDRFIALNGLTGRVRFKGYVDNRELPGLLTAFNLVLLPSLKEGLPVSILEALASGVPVLSSDSGGGSRFILQDGNGGYVVDDLDVDSWVNAIKGIRAMDMEALGSLVQRGLDRVRTHFSADTEASSYKQRYKRITGIHGNL